MTVRQLKEELNELPENMEVYVAPRVTEFAYGYVNSVYIKEIGFSEDEDGEILCKEKVVIIDEE